MAHRLVHVLLAVGGEDDLHHRLDEPLLVLRQLADGHAREAARGALNENVGLLRRLRHQGGVALLAVEGLEDLVGLLGLVIEDVAGQPLLPVPGTVAVDHRAAERGVRDAVAVGTERDVSAGQFPLELAAAGGAEDGDVVLAEPAGVVVHLLLDALVAVGLRMPRVISCRIACWSLV